MQDMSVPKDLKTIQSAQTLSGLVTHSGNRFFDNSTLDSFRVCPRRFYYSKIRKWRPDSTSTPLIFGTCWHAAMDFLWANPKATSQQAFEVFMSKWNKSELKDAEHFDLFPRSPGRAKEMLDEYVKRYGSWLQSIELVAVEKPFVVPLDTNHKQLFYVGKWDKLYKEGSYYTIVDHKTSSSFANTWLNSWSPNGQVDGYLYAGHMQYGDMFRNVIIDGALVQKTKVDFLKVPVERQIYMLDQWKWEVIDLIEQIFFYENDLLQIRSEGSKSDSFLKTFPKCTTSCTSYYGMCPFNNLCKFVPNPESITDIPDGFVHDSWKPFDITETADGSEFIIKAHEGE